MNKDRTVFKDVSQFVVRNNVAIVTVIAIITIVFGYFAIRVTFNTDFATYLSQDSKIVREFRRSGELFGSNYIAIIVVRPENRGLFSREQLEELQDLNRRYEQTDGIRGVLSLINAPNAVETADGIAVNPLIGYDRFDDDGDVDAARQRVAENGLYRDLLLDSTGDATVMLLNLDPDANHLELARAIRSIAEQTAGSLDGYYFGGMPFVMYAMGEGITRNIVYLGPFILLLLAVILFVGFRNLRGVVFPLLVVVISTIWVMGLFRLTGTPLDMLTSIVPVILIAMGSADSIHLLRRIQEDRRTDVGQALKVRDALNDLAMPMTMTTITTMVGFASLAISDFSVIRTFGIATAGAILIALIVTFLFLPAAVSLIRTAHVREASRDEKTTLTTRLMDRLAFVLLTRRRTMLTGTLLVVMVALLGLPLIVVNVDWSLCLARGSKPYEAEMMLRDRFGGSLPLQVSVKGDILDPAVLNQVASIATYANSLPLVSRSVSVAETIAELNYTLNGKYAIPDSTPAIASLWLLVQNESSLEQLVAPNETEALVQGRIAGMATAEIRQSAEKVNEYLADAPARLAVLDASLLGADGRRIVEEERRRQVATSLRRLTGIDRAEDVIEQLLTGTSVDDIDSVRTYLERELVRFLIEGQIDLTITDGAVADDLGRAIAGLSADAGSPESLRPLVIEAIVADRLPHTDPDDRYWLADSLAFELRNLAQAHRVDRYYSAIAQLPDYSPGTADDGRIRTELWKLENQYVAVDRRLYEQYETLLENGLARHVSVETELTGMVPVLNQMEQQLMPTQIKSVVITLAVVFLLLALLFRSLAAGMIGAVPTALTVLVNFAVLGYAGIGLDSFTALIASVVIGLGIDYTIHFLSRFRHELERKPDDLAALRHTLHTTGTSIVLNALAVGAGFGVLLLAYGQHVRLFGGLLGLSVVMSAVFTLVVVPLLVVLIKPRFYRVAIRQRSQI